MDQFVAPLRRLEDLNIHGEVGAVVARALVEALRHCRLRRARIGTYDSPYSRPASRGTAAASYVVAGSMRSYRWLPGSSLLATLALHHASSIEEFSLFHTDLVALDLLDKTWMETDMFTPLMKLRALKRLTLQIHVNTFFEDHDQAETIVDYWQSPLSPQTTSLVVHNVTGTDENRWSRRLQALKPVNMAQRLTALLAHDLHQDALARNVEVTAHFCLGIVGHPYELQVLVGLKDNVPCCLNFRGPFKAKTYRICRELM